MIEDGTVALVERHADRVATVVCEFLANVNTTASPVTADTLVARHM